MILEFDFGFLDLVHHKPSGVQGRVAQVSCDRDGCKQVQVVWYDDKKELREWYRHDECELVSAAVQSEP